MNKELYDKGMAEVVAKMSEPARDHALAFVAKWAERTGNDLYGPEAEEVFEQAYADASEAMEAGR
jgi:hypothetical protein